MIRRVAVKVAYLGSGFAGSQRQPGYTTVEGEILRALELLSGQMDFDLKCSSRTDRDVNALGNVFVFNTDFKNLEELMRALNAVSKGVYYRGYSEVSETFGPRMANERTYRYVLPSDNIDIDLAKECSKIFIGKHDFANFCKSDDKSTMAEIDSITVEKEKDIIVIEFKACFYLWNMIRRIVAAIEMVGKKNATPEDVKAVLDLKKDNYFGLARADALTLVDVFYKDIDFIYPVNENFRRIEREETFSNNLKNNFYSSL